jgi:hypothetical protein
MQSDKVPLVADHWVAPKSSRRRRKTKVPGELPVVNFMMSCAFLVCISHPLCPK